MQIEVPNELGKIIDSQLKEGGPNVILAADRHSSGPAQKNITNLYIHLAENYGLKVVGIEGSCDFIRLGRKERVMSPSEFQDLLDRGINGPKGLVWDHAELILVAASRLGYDLVYPKCLDDANLARASLYIKSHMFEMSQHEAKTKLAKFELTLSNLFASLSNRISTEALASLSSFYLGRLTCDEFLTKLGFLRTTAQLNVLLDQMKRSQTTLSLLTRGQAHVGEFLELAKLKSLGYLIFEPTGFEIRDHLEEYRAIAGEMIQEASDYAGK